MSFFGINISPKIRSAQVPCGTRAIMKKFILIASFDLIKVYQLNMNKI